MITVGQLWILRRLNQVIDEVERAASNIFPDTYSQFSHYATDVYDEALSRVYDDSVTDFNSDNFNDKYTSVLSTMEDLFNPQLKEYYDSVVKENITESFDKILDLFNKRKKGFDLKPSEETMLRAFRKFVDKGGYAEEFVYDEEMDYDYDDREGQTFEYNGFDMPLIYTFSEEYEQDGEINYFGEIKFEDDEFLGVISTDQRGYLTGYDFYSVLEDDVRLQDILKDMQIEDEVTNFFAEEVIPVLKR